MLSLWGGAPLYSHDDCKEPGIEYQSEIDIVTHWLEMLPDSYLLPPDILRRVCVLLDSGYDAKRIQNVKNDNGMKSIASITCERSVSGLPVKEYFWRNRNIPWRTIQVKSGAGVG